MPKTYKLSLLIIVLLMGCLNSRQKTDDPPVAKVYDEYLYLSELKETVPNGLSPEDSLQVSNDHIDKWIRNQLLFYQAQQNLSLDEKYLERQIEDYRTSLLIFKYEQSYIEDKLDTLIQDSLIEEYYNQYSSNFILNNHILKGVFVKVPRSAPQTWRARRLYKSDEPGHYKELEEYCFNHAEEFNYFEEEWVMLNEVLPGMPRLYMSPENLLRYRKHIEVKDSTYYYFLKISDYRLEGSVTPLEIVKDDIKSILLNKRKIQLIQELEASIYNDALDRGNFIKYN